MSTKWAKRTLNIHVQDIWSRRKHWWIVLCWEAFSFKKVTAAWTWALTLSWVESVLPVFGSVSVREGYALVTNDPNTSVADSEGLFLMSITCLHCVGRDSVPQDFTTEPWLTRQVLFWTPLILMTGQNGDHVPGPKASAQKWRMFLLLRCHWPKHVTWLCVSAPGGKWHSPSLTSTSRRNWMWMNIK